MRPVKRSFAIEMLDDASKAGTLNKDGDACAGAASAMISSKGKPRIAIVDDDPSICRALRRLVATREINAETFTSGRNFLDALRAVPPFEPDCVILDMHMHGLDGIEV